MPRSSSKARAIAYEILGVPGCLEGGTKKPPKKKNQGEFNIDLNNVDSQKP